jgi:hypothetical protein
VDDLTDAIGRIAKFLEGYRKRHQRSVQLVSTHYLSAS